MASGWTSFRNRFGRRPQGEIQDSPSRQVIVAEAVPAPQPKSEAVMARPDGALDSVGQKNELIRVRFANLIDRLEEIRSLKDDFTLLSEPVYDLIRSYPQLQSRLLETEAVLKQETETTAALRRELADLSAISRPPSPSCASPRPRCASRNPSSRTCGST